jgi:hypothetical protein
VAAIGDAGQGELVWEKRKAIAKVLARTIGWRSYGGSEFGKAVKFIGGELRRGRRKKMADGSRYVGGVAFSSCASSCSSPPRRRGHVNARTGGARGWWRSASGSVAAPPWLSTVAEAPLPLLYPISPDFILKHEIFQIQKLSSSKRSPRLL